MFKNRTALKLNGHNESIIFLISQKNIYEKEALKYVFFIGNFVFFQKIASAISRKGQKCD